MFSLNQWCSCGNPVSCQWKMQRITSSHASVSSATAGSSTNNNEVERWPDLMDRIDRRINRLTTQSGESDRKRKEKRKYSETHWFCPNKSAFLFFQWFSSCFSTSPMCEPFPFSSARYMLLSLLSILDSLAVASMFGHERSSPTSPRQHR